MSLLLEAMAKKVKDMDTTEMEEEAGIDTVKAIRKKVIEERLYEIFKDIGKR